MGVQKMSYRKLLSLFWGLLIIFLFCRCSLIGLAIGSKHDADGPEIKQVSFDAISSVKLGRQLDVFMVNGNTVSGEYLGIGQISQIDYSDYYNECLNRLPEGFELPLIGEDVNVALNSGEKFTMNFQGFDFLLHSLILVNTERSNPLYMDEIAGIEYDNSKYIDMETLGRLVKDREIPIFSGIMLENESKEISLITGNEINHIFVKNKKFGKLKGFLIGAALDIPLIIDFINGNLVLLGYSGNPDKDK